MFGRIGFTGLENLAHLPSLRQPAKGERRMAGGTAEAAHEVRQVSEAAVQRHLRHRPRVLGQQPRGTAQAAADQVLVRRDADHAREQAQEVVAAAADLRGGRIQVNRFGAVGVDPVCGPHCAAALARAGLARRGDRAGVQRDEARCQRQAEFVQRQRRAPGSGGSRQFAQHHQRRMRRHRHALPGAWVAADLFDEFGVEGEAQAFIAAGVVLVGTQVLVAGMADEERAARQLPMAAAAAAAETAAQHVGQRMPRMPFAAWRVLRAGTAAPQRGRELPMAGGQRQRRRPIGTNCHDG